MPYTPTNWVENVTTLGPTNLNHIEGGIAAAVAADSVTVAGTRILASKLVGTDTQPAWQVNGDGRLNWGPGGSTATDTTLYRGGANVLQTDSTLLFSSNSTAPIKTNQASGNVLVNRLLPADANGVFLITATGGLYWGPGGSTANDVKLYRQAPQLLQCDSTLQSLKGVATYVKAGAPVDGDFSSAIDGLLVVDTTNSKFWCRVGGTWKGVAVA